MTNTNQWIFNCTKCGKQYAYVLGAFAPVCCGKSTVMTRNDVLGVNHSKDKVIATMPDYATKRYFEVKP